MVYCLQVRGKVALGINVQNKLRIKHTFKSYLAHKFSRLNFVAGFLLFIAVVSSLYPLAQTLVARAAPYVYTQVGQISNSVDMDEPMQFAVDSAGNYYTTSINDDHYVRKFSPTGTELMRFGNIDWSSATGELGWAGGIAIKSNGEIYVSDGDSYRINVYGTTGQFLREITTFGAGLSFNYNQEIHFAANGNLYVLDNGDTIHVFDSNDTYINSYTNPGIGNGQFSNAYDFAVDTNGDLYIGDYGNNRIQVLNTSWTYLRQFNSGGLNNPTSVALTTDSHVLALDDSHDIKKYTTAGAFVTTIGTEDNPLVGGWGVANGELFNASDILVLANNNISTLESYPSRIQTFAPGGAYLTQFGNAGSEPGQIGQGVVDITTDTSGNVYVPDMNNKRVQKFDANGNFLMEFGNQTIFAGTPNAIAVSPVNGNIYVFDGYSGICNSRILVFNPAGTQLGTVGNCADNGIGAGNFANLGVSLAVTSTGDLVVNDTSGVNSKIMYFNAAGTFLREWVTTPDNSSIRFPGVMGLDSADNVYIVTSTSSYIIKYDPNGNVLATFGKAAAGTTDGYLRGANDINIAPNGMMYVAEADNSSISVFDSNGNFMRRFGTWGYGQNQFMYPQALSLGTNGKLYVADDMNNRIAIYDAITGPDAASAPQNLSVTYAGSGTLSVTWDTPTSDGGDPINGYLVEYQIQGTHNEWETYGRLPANQHSLTMDGLSAGKYTVRAIATNRAGHSLPTAASQAIQVHAALELKSVITPNKPVQDTISGIGVYADGSATLMSRRFSSRVHVNAGGTETARFGNFGVANGQARNLRSADTDPSDKLYVADDQNARITKYNKDGSFVANYSTGARYPLDVTVDQTGSFYYVITSTFSDGFTGRVEKYTTAGVFVAVVAPAITSASAMTVGPDGSLYIAHSTGPLVQVAKYAADGTTALGTYGQNGIGNDGLISPNGVGVLSTGQVIVSDAYLDVVKIFAADGSVLGKLGSASGGFFHQFKNPGRIQVANDLIYAAQEGNPQVNVYAAYTIPPSTPPTAPQNVTVNTTTPQSLQVDWAPPASDGNDPITDYVIEYKKDSAVTWTTVVVPPSELTLTVSDLAAGTYDVRIHTRNGIGDSPIVELTGNIVLASPVVPVVVIPPVISTVLASTGNPIYAPIAVGATLIATGVIMARHRVKMDS